MTRFALYASSIYEKKNKNTSCSYVHVNKYSKRKPTLCGLCLLIQHHRFYFKNADEPPKINVSSSPALPLRLTSHLNFLNQIKIKGMVNVTC